MKSEANMVIAAIDEGQADVESRGLEAHSKEGTWIAYKKRKELYDVILGEQEKQMRARKKDWDKIAKLSSSESARCRKEAVSRGKEDERVAKLCHGTNGTDVPPLRKPPLPTSSLPSLASSFVSDDSADEVAEERKIPSDIPENDSSDEEGSRWFYANIVTSPRKLFAAKQPDFHDSKPRIKSPPRKEKQLLRKKSASDDDTPSFAGESEHSDSCTSESDSEHPLHSYMTNPRKMYGDKRLMPDFHDSSSKIKSPRRSEKGALLMLNASVHTETEGDEDDLSVLSASSDSDVSSIVSDSEHSFFSSINPNSPCTSPGRLSKDSAKKLLKDYHEGLDAEKKGKIVPKEKGQVDGVEVNQKKKRKSRKKKLSDELKSMKKKKKKKQSGAQANPTKKKKKKKLATKLKLDDLNLSLSALDGLASHSKHCAVRRSSDSMNSSSSGLQSALSVESALASPKATKLLLGALHKVSPSKSPLTIRMEDELSPTTKNTVPRRSGSPFTARKEAELMGASQKVNATAPRRSRSPTSFRREDELVVSPQIHASSRRSRSPFAARMEDELNKSSPETKGSVSPRRSRSARKQDDSSSPRGVARRRSASPHIARKMDTYASPRKSVDNDETRRRRSLFAKLSTV